MSLPHLILGLLKDQPFSGYDLNKAFQNTVRHFWTTDQSQIYRALHKMRDNGWVDVEVILQDDNPNKKVYHITEAGRAELHRWLLSDFPEPPIREVWLGHIFFTTAAELDRLLEKLRAAIAYLQQLHALLDALELPPYDTPGIDMNLSLRLLTLDYGKMRYESDIAWMRKTIDWIEHKRNEQSQEEPQT